MNFYVGGVGKIAGVLTKARSYGIIILPRSHKNLRYFKDLKGISDIRTIKTIRTNIHIII